MSDNIPQNSGRSNVRMALILGALAIVFLGVYLYVHAVG